VVGSGGHVAAQPYTIHRRADSRRTGQKSGVEMTDQDIVDAVEFDSPLKSDEAVGGPVLPLSLQAAVKPIIEMLAVVQARLRKVEKLQWEQNAILSDLTSAVWGLDLREVQQD